MKANFLSILALPVAAALLMSAPSDGSRKQNVAKLGVDNAGQGTLLGIDPYSKNTGAACPLKSTDVKAEITGFLARVTVTQEFENNSPNKIEAVYVFPLPQRSAVDRMTMQVGDRRIEAVIKRRDEARKLFEDARNQGHVASLLEQERPNIFTQNVTNIEPGAKVKVEISYVETLKYEDGSYEFSFPMVVGPRYIPGSSTGQTGTGWAPNTNQVPDASRITPRLAPEGVRAGHDITLSVNVDAGVPIDKIVSPSHPIDSVRKSSREAGVQLARRNEIPNKDFILRYDVAGVKMQDALLTHRGARGGFFTFILQPPESVTAEDVTPKELVFVLDTSGSMSGFPIEKAKETMRLALAGLYPRDTFNLITFAGDTHLLFPAPVPATRENLQLAQQFLEGRRGGGGTEMMKAIRAALAPSGDPEKVRIVCFMTDGYVGNDLEIIGEVKKYTNARVFSFGIGSSVNRFLLDKMAEEGRGEVEYVGLNDDGSAAARRFHERVRSPLLTDISIQWNGLPVTDVYPQRIPDLFSAKPVFLTGRFTAPASGVLRLSGKMAGKPYSREVRVNLPSNEAAHDVLATLWARTKIDDLMSRDYQGMQQGRPVADVENAITQLGLDYKLMTQFTSFIAIEKQRVTRDGKPVIVEVPLDMPDGVSHEGVFGSKDGRREMGASMGMMRKSAAVNAAPPPLMSIIPRAAPRINEADVVRQAPEGKAGEKVTITLWLADWNDAIKKKLDDLGFEETEPSKVAKIRTGKIRVEKLLELQKLEFVLQVTRK